MGGWAHSLAVVQIGVHNTLSRLLIDGGMTIPKA
jgi:hypothetical protein